MKTAYKIFDLYIDKAGNFVPKTLFHGLEGSRVLPVGKTLRAEKKMVTDGSGVNAYESGFHAYHGPDDIKNWLKGAKNLKNRVVVKVLVGETWPKPRAVRPTILANLLRIPKKCWEERISAEDFLHF